VRNKLISGLAGVAFSFAASGLALAQAPPPAPRPVYNWTGWYVGVNAGASFGNVNTDFGAFPITLATTVSGDRTNTPVENGMSRRTRRYYASDSF
jgi:hypothetical protein